jgi:hypothetical protein
MLHIDNEAAAGPRQYRDYNAGDPACKDGSSLTSAREESQQQRHERGRQSGAEHGGQSRVNERPAPEDGFRRWYKAWYCCGAWRILGHAYK